MNQNIANKITKLFNLPPLRYAGKAKGGFLSDNYILINSSQKYFLKQYRPSAHARLPVIEKAETFFARNSLPVILSIKTKRGKSYFQIGKDFYSLYPFVTGKTVNHKKGQVTTALAKAMANNLAIMHLLSKRNFPRISHEPLSEWDPKKVLSKEARESFYHYANKILQLLNEKRRKNDVDRMFFSMLKLKLSMVSLVPTKIKIPALGRGHIVHGDYHAQNLFFNKQGDITHIFDFEKSDIRPRSLEVVRSMFIVCFNGKFNTKRFALAKAYLTKYNSVYPIKKEEVGAAICFMYHKHILNLWMEKEHYLNKNTRPDPLIKGELQFLRHLSKNIDKLINKLLD